MSKRRQPRIKTIPPAKHHNYALVWDLADQMAKKTGKTVENCWHQIIVAFWSGKLCRQLFCFVHPKRSGTPGRNLVALPPRDEIAKALLGQHRVIDAGALGELSGWTLDHYRNDHLFRDYIGPRRPPAPGEEPPADDRTEKRVGHPALGLSIRLADFERWDNREREHLHHPLSSAGAKSKRESIAEFIKSNYGYGMLPAGTTRKIIARDFRARGGAEVSERTVSRALGRK